MRYADSNCTYVEVYDPHGYIFTGPCIVTGVEYSVFVLAEELFLYRKGGYIQDCLSNSEEDREFLMSGISPEGWILTMAEELYDTNNEFS